MGQSPVVLIAIYFVSGVLYSNHYQQICSKSASSLAVWTKATSLLASLSFSALISLQRLSRQKRREVLESKVRRRSYGRDRLLGLFVIKKCERRHLDMNNNPAHSPSTPEEHLSGVILV